LNRLYILTRNVKINRKKIARSENLIEFVMKKGTLNFFIILDNVKITSCKHPKGQIQPQKILFPIKVKRIMAPAIIIMGRGTNPTI
jgi:hypothetical protein